MARKIVVIGMGYVGIPIAALFADVPGFTVVGVQRRSKRSGWKIDWVNKGKNPIGGDEPGLSDLIARVVKKGTLKVVEDVSTVKDAEAVLIRDGRPGFVLTTGVSLGTASTSRNVVFGTPVNILTLVPTADSIYIKPGESILVDMNVSQLQQYVNACQAMLGYSSFYFGNPTDQGGLNHYFAVPTRKRVIQTHGRLLVGGLSSPNIWPAGNPSRSRCTTLV